MIGTTVANCQILEKAGEGGMGEVFRGIDLMLEREVAIKVLRPELAHDQALVDRFRSEAITLARLNHPNIATLYGFVRHGGGYSMILEFAHGEPLDQVLKSRRAVPVGEAIGIIKQVLLAIDHAHRLGVVHRDIKPSNLIVTRDGTVKVLDFGIARVLGSLRHTQVGRVVGTVGYMSPEQVRGAEGDIRSDVYALGVVLYELLTGEFPFAFESDYELIRAQVEDVPVRPGMLAPGLPREIDAAVMRALAKRPEDRFQSAREFLAAIDEASQVSGHAWLVEAVDEPPTLEPTLLAPEFVVDGFEAEHCGQTRVAAESDDLGRVEAANATEAARRRGSLPSRLPAAAAGLVLCLSLVSLILRGRESAVAAAITHAPVTQAEIVTSSTEQTAKLELPAVVPPDQAPELPSIAPPSTRRPIHRPIRQPKHRSSRRRRSPASARQPGGERRVHPVTSRRRDQP